MSAVLRSGPLLSGPVDLIPVVDGEETRKGIRYFLTERDRTAYVGSIVAEPTNLQTVIAARGAAYIEIRVTGKTAHSGNPAQGAHAIYGVATVISDLEGWHHELAEHAQPLVGPMWSVGLVNGGTGTSTVRAECSILVDRRMLPAESPSQVLQDT